MLRSLWYLPLVNERALWPTQRNAASVQRAVNAGCYGKTASVNRAVSSRYRLSRNGQLQNTKK